MIGVLGIFARILCLAMVKCESDYRIKHPCEQNWLNSVTRGYLFVSPLFLLFSFRDYYLTIVRCSLCNFIMNRLLFSERVISMKIYYQNRSFKKHEECWLNELILDDSFDLRDFWEYLKRKICMQAVEGLTFVKRFKKKKMWKCYKEYC